MLRLRSWPAEPLKTAQELLTVCTGLAEPDGPVLGAHSRLASCPPSLAPHVRGSSLAGKGKWCLEPWECRCPPDGSCWRGGPVGKGEAVPSHVALPRGNPWPLPQRDPREETGQEAALSFRSGDSPGDCRGTPGRTLPKQACWSACHGELRCGQSNRKSPNEEHQNGTHGLFCHLLRCYLPVCWRTPGPSWERAPAHLPIQSPFHTQVAQV